MIFISKYFRFCILCLLFIFLLSSCDNSTEFKTIQTKDYQIKYLDQGIGVPCLVIGAAKNDEVLFRNGIRNNVRLIMVNSPAFNNDLSSEVVQKYTLKQVCDDMELVRKKLGLGKVVIIGNSTQGVIAYRYAQEYPQNVLKIIMVASFPDVDPGAVVRKQITQAYFAQEATPDRQQLMAAAYPQIMALDSTPMSYRDKEIKRYVLSAPIYWYDATFDCTHLFDNVDLNEEADKHLYYKLIKDKGFSYVNSMLPENLKIPMLVIHGKYDFAVPQVVWSDIVNAWSMDARNGSMFKYIEFIKSSHHPQYEEPELFNKTIIDFIYFQ